MTAELVTIANEILSAVREAEPWYMDRTLWGAFGGALLAFCFGAVLLYCQQKRQFAHDRLLQAAEHSRLLRQLCRDKLERSAELTAEIAQWANAIGIVAMGRLGPETIPQNQVFVLKLHIAAYAPELSYLSQKIESLMETLFELSLGVLEEADSMANTDKIQAFDAHGKELLGQLSKLGDELFEKQKTYVEPSGNSLP